MRSVICGGDRRWRRGHPWWFMLALGTLVASVLAGDLFSAVAMLAACWWMLLRG